MDGDLAFQENMRYSDGTDLPSVARGDRHNAVSDSMRDTLNSSERGEVAVAPLGSPGGGSLRDAFGPSGSLGAPPLSSSYSSSLASTGASATQQRVHPMQTMAHESGHGQQHGQHYGGQRRSGDDGQLGQLGQLGQSGHSQSGRREGGKRRYGEPKPRGGGRSGRGGRYGSSNPLAARRSGASGRRTGRNSVNKSRLPAVLQRAMQAIADPSEHRHRKVPRGELEPLGRGHNRGGRYPHGRGHRRRRRRRAALVRERGERGRVPCGGGWRWEQ